MQWGLMFTLFVLLPLYTAAIAEEPSAQTDSTKTDNTETTDTSKSDQDSENSSEFDEANSLDSSTSPTETKPNAEITVYGKREVDRRRSILDDQLKDNGYRSGKRRGDKVVYRPETVWHPSVVVYDSGWVDLRKTPPRFEPWIGGHPDNKWRYLSCIPPFGLMCIRASGWLITKRRAQHSKTAVIENNIETIQYWQESVVGLATQERLEVQLPDELDAIWASETLSSAERTEQIVYLWSTRTCTPEGAAAAGIIADYLAFEVHPSAPVPVETLAWMTTNNSCNHPLPSIE